MCIAKMADCTELNNLREDVSSVDIHDSNRAKFLSNYIDAYLACNQGQQDVLVKAVAEGRGGAVNSVAKAIAADMGIDDNEALEIDILEKLAQISESKGPISGDAQKDDRSHLGADPVMLFKGQFVHEVDDIHISGAGIDFFFKRTYKNQVVFNGPLGYNWMHNFHIWLRVAVADRVIFRSTGDLREEPFTRHPLFDENNLVIGEFDYWIPPDGKHGVIFAENSSFVLRQPDGSRQIFEPDPAHSFLHRLSRIEDRFRNYLRLHYDADQRLAQIEINHLQRLVAFDYDAEDRICSIRDYTGREWGYKYDSIGDLIAVTSPSTERYDCGLTVNYDYSSAFHSGNLQHNLVRIIDAAGQIYLETEYGTSRGLLNFNRVVRQRQGGGEYLFEYEDIDQVFDLDDYPDEQKPAHQTVLVERNGQPVTHIYNKFGNLLQREQCVIERGLPRKLVEQYRYDRDGNVVSSLSPEGVFTQHLFGRDYFVRHHGLTENGDVPTNDLTWKERQAFGRIRATVRRGGYASFDSFTLTRGIWGSFPDILDGQFPFTVPERSQDIIIKMTYEDDFGQLLTVSDPRFTNSADPDELEEPNEHLRHKDTLTRYTYSGPTQLLVKIKYPIIPLLPDGTLGAEIAGIRCKWPSTTLNQPSRCSNRTDLFR
jgi:YD repeat-containing protein